MWGGREERKAQGRGWDVSMLESRQTLVWGLDLPSREASDLQVSAPARLPELQRVTSFLGQSTH